MRARILLCLLGASLMAADGLDSAPGPDGTPGLDSVPGPDSAPVPDSGPIVGVGGTGDSAPMDSNPAPERAIQAGNSSTDSDDSVRPHLDLGYNGTRADLRRLYSRVELSAYGEREAGAACAGALALLLAPFVRIPFGAVQFGLGDSHCPRGAVRRGALCIRRT